jgi:hypothetical protein
MNRKEAQRAYYRRNKEKIRHRVKSKVDPETGVLMSSLSTMRSRRKMIESMSQEEVEIYRERQRFYWRKYNSSRKGKTRLRQHMRNKRACSMFRVMDNLRTVCVRFMAGRGKTKRLRELIGMTSDQLRAHIERQFTEGMTWDNFGRGRGKWNVDHRIPLTHFKNLATDVEDQKVAFSWRNLSPKWCIDNVRKGNRYAEPLLLMEAAA